MTAPELDYALISDIHFYHRRTPTSHIAKALWEWLFTHDKYISKCRVLFIAGDIFDRFIPSHYPDILYVNQFFYKLGVYLRDKNILLRVLEGTITHDRRQFNSVLPILEATGVDVKYHASVVVENIEGTSVLYVPDNWKVDTHETFLDAKAAVLAAGLTQCDIAIMHGAFEYQLPMMPKVTFNQRDFESIVKKRIHVGHVHIPSKNGKINAQGSFDRLSHGEPGDKGGHVCIHGKVKRLINHNSFEYRSLYLPLKDDLSVDQIEQLIDDTVVEMKYLGWLRIQAHKYHAIYEHLARIQQKYVGVRFERQYVVPNKEDIITTSPTVSHLSTETIMQAIREWDPTLPDEPYKLIETKLKTGDTPFANPDHADGP